MNDEEDYIQTMAMIKRVEDETKRVNQLKLRNKIRVHQNRIVYITKVNANVSLLNTHTPKHQSNSNIYPCRQLPHYT